MYGHSAPALVMVGHWGLTFQVEPPGGTPFDVVARRPGERMRRAARRRRVAAAACVAAPVARADGDPASDYLLTQQMFLPFNVKIPTGSSDALRRSSPTRTRRATRSASQ